MTTAGWAIVVVAMTGWFVTCIFGYATVRYDRVQAALDLVWHGFVALAVVGLGIVVLGYVL